MDKATETKESGPVTSSKNNSPWGFLNKIVSRRGFLKGAVQVTAAGAVGAGIGKNFSPSDEEVKAEIQPLPKPDVTVVPIKGKNADITRREIPGVVEKNDGVSVPLDKAPPIFDELSKDDVKRVTSFFKFESFYKSLPSVEGQFARSLIEESKSNLKKMGALESDLANSERYKKMILDVLEKYEFSKEFKKSQIPKLLPGLIFQESKGLPYLISEAGAEGLCQIMPVNIPELAKEIGLQDPDAFNPEHSIAMGLKYLESLYGLFTDEGLTLQAYNMGPTNMLDILNNVYPGNDLTSNNCADFIKSHNINFVDVYWSEYMQNEVIGKWQYGDHIKTYVPNILAADELM